MTAVLLHPHADRQPIAQRVRPGPKGPVIAYLWRVRHERAARIARLQGLRAELERVRSSIGAHRAAVADLEARRAALAREVEALERNLRRGQ